MEILEAVRDEGKISSYVKKHHRITLESLINAELIKQVNETYEITEKGSNYLQIRENYRCRKLGNGNVKR